MSQTDKLISILKPLQPLAIALSGGMDSRTLVLFCQKQEIVHKSFTVTGPHVTFTEIRQVINFRRIFSLDHLFFYFDYRRFPLISQNTRQRCYYCKKNIFSHAGQFFSAGFNLADGSNASDADSYRPGMAALAELGVASPFALAGMGKGDILGLAADLGLDTVNYFPRSCLLTRFSYDTPLDSALTIKLGLAEDFLLQKCLSGFRLRFPDTGRYLLQVADSQKQAFDLLADDFLIKMKELGLYPYDVQYSPFELITGFYDR
ncbi:hypothetical protein [Desulfonatronovibrio hydrogenovorans]|uniref:hypothetical protein n=1 Tax=Desulfonatronovibrio hydrogenovorans TaxID=53245 RepID=UPI000490614E|nr:hypothetical protein [Desulfonatronovibrio hydrogenovorans]